MITRPTSEGTKGALVIKDIRRDTRRQYSAKKIRIILDGLPGVGSVVELCRQEDMIADEEDIE